MLQRSVFVKMKRKDFKTHQPGVTRFDITAFEYANCYSLYKKLITVQLMPPRNECSNFRKCSLYRLKCIFRCLKNAFHVLLQQTVETLAEYMLWAYPRLEKHV